MACCTSHKLTCSPAVAKEVQQQQQPAEIITTSKHSVLDENVDDDYQALSEEQKRKLRKSSEIKKWPGSKRLQQELLSIDESSNRSDRLKLARQNREFEEFVQQVFDVISS